MVNIPTWGKKFHANPEGTPGLPPLRHNIDRCMIIAAAFTDIIRLVTLEMGNSSNINPATDVFSI
jgi:hypothetical protein